MELWVIALIIAVIAISIYFSVKRENDKKSEKDGEMEKAKQKAVESETQKLEELGKQKLANLEEKQKDELKQQQIEEVKRQQTAKLQEVKLKNKQKILKKQNIQSTELLAKLPGLVKAYTDKKDLKSFSGTCDMFDDHNEIVHLINFIKRVNLNDKNILPTLDNYKMYDTVLESEGCTNESEVEAINRILMN